MAIGDVDRHGVAIRRGSQQFGHAGSACRASDVDDRHRLADCRFGELADETGQLVGTAAWVGSSDGRATARIKHVYVRPFFTGLGIGHRLVGEMERLAAEHGVPFRMPAVFPQNSLQAARLALGFVLRSLGDRAAARAAIDPALNTSPRNPADDPWWDYYDGDAGQLERLLEELRAPFSRPR